MKTKTTCVLLGSSVLFGAGVWVGCGSSDSSTILNGSDDAGNSAGDGGNNTGTTDGSSGGSDAGGAGTDASASKDTGTGEASTKYDGGGPGGDTTSLPCGVTFCTIATQVCCVDTLGGTTSAACVTGSTCPVPDAGAGGNPPDVTTLKCTGQANCAAGSLCCVTQTGGKGGPNLVSSACVVGTTCAPGDGQLCDPGAAPTGCALDAGQCSSTNIGDWGLLPPFATCGGIGN